MIRMQIFIETSHGRQGISKNNYQFPIIIHRQIKLNCTAFMRLLMPLKWYYLPIIHIQYDELYFSHSLSTRALQHYIHDEITLQL